jgi:6-phosphogluconolactonase
VVSGVTVRVHRDADSASVADRAAHFLADAMKLAIAERGMCRLALAGGSTPRVTYERLTAPDLSSVIDWSKLEVFFGDERMVPPDDAASNYRMAKEALLDRVPIPKGNIRRILGEEAPAVAAERYAAALGDAPLDVVLLGMGDDGHVASLFPGGPELEHGGRTVTSHAPIAPHSRVSITFDVINGARSVVMLVTGPSKASRLREVFAEAKAAQSSGKPTLPAARVAPKNGALHWFLDAPAASQLDVEGQENVPR